VRLGPRHLPLCCRALRLRRRRRRRLPCHRVHPVLVADEHRLQQRGEARVAGLEARLRRVPGRKMLVELKSTGVIGASSEG